jgi:hypothetical protein
MRFNRRKFLSAAGAGVALAPFARLLPQAAHALSGTPKRLIVFWTPNGTAQDAFWPSGSGSSFQLNTVMEPLASHQADLTIIKNVTFSGTGDHKTGKPFSTTGFPREDETTGKSEGASIDQVVADALGAPPIVVCGESKGNVRGYVSYDANKNKVNPTKDPKAAYETIFGALPTTGSPPPSSVGEPTPAPGGRDDELHNLILETSMADIEQLRSRLPAAEQVKMDDQLAALVALKKDLAGGGGGSSGPPTASCTDLRPALDQRIAGGTTGYGDRVKQHSDLIVTAFACGVRQVASFMLAPAGHDNMGGHLSFIDGVGGDVHNNIAHPDPGGERMVQVHRYHAEQLAYLIERLKSVREGSGTLFDNTVILWTSECTHGNHGHRNIPVVVAGSAGGTLKTGQFINGGEPNYNDVLLALMHAVGHEVGSFGNSSNGPLTELMA